MTSPTLEIPSMAAMSATRREHASVGGTIGMAAPQPWQPLPPGTRLGRYVVGSLLGRGGMGAVYLGHDPALGRSVALKVAHGEGWDDAEPRMAREARMLAQVSDPHVVQIFDVGRFDGGTFVAMEPIRGRTLSQWLRDGHRRHAEVLRVFSQAGRGLVAIHRAGLVHRDFKPANVVVGQDGRVRVLDFGLAVGTGLRTPTVQTGAQAVDATRLTSTGEAVGTPAYMAPEQHRGGPIDERADQFAFCSALFEALTGERPHRGHTLRELLEEKVAETARHRRRRLPRRARRAVMRGLRAERSERWPSMGCLLGTLPAA